MIWKNPALPKSRSLGKELQEERGSGQSQKIRCSPLYGREDGRGGRREEKGEERGERWKRKEERGVSVLFFCIYVQRAEVQRISMSFEPELDLGPLEPLLSDPRQATASMTRWGNGGTWQWEGKMNQA